MKTRLFVLSLALLGGILLLAKMYQPAFALLAATLIGIGLLLAKTLGLLRSVEDFAKRNAQIEGTYRQLILDQQARRAERANKSS